MDLGGKASDGSCRNGVAMSALTVPGPIHGDGRSDNLGIVDETAGMHEDPLRLKVNRAQMNRVEPLEGGEKERTARAEGS